MAKSKPAAQRKRKYVVRHRPLKRKKPEAHLHSLDSDHSHRQASAIQSIESFLHCNLCRTILGLTLQALGATLTGEGLGKVLSDQGVVVAHRGDSDFHRLDEDCKPAEKVPEG
jgi:hypothetical protein